MSSLSFLKRYFLTGTAEEDLPFLQQAFVSSNQLSEIVGIQSGAMRLIVGNKGIGKTALFEFLETCSNKHKLPCILVRPDDISSQPLASTNDLASLKRFYFDALLRAIAMAIGRNHQGLLVGDARTLYEEAQRQGQTSEDFIQTTLRLLTAISVPVKGVDGVKLAKELAGVATNPELTRAVNSQLLDGNSKVAFLLIDDTDQVAPPGNSDHLNRVWGLLLAARKVATDCPNVRVLVSLRSEIWLRLQSEAKGQRDQTDHLRNLVVRLHSNDEHMRKIIIKRMNLAAVDAGHPRTDPYSLFFVSSQVTLPYSTEHRSWESFIIKSARERPRDAIQLIRKLIDSTINGQKIGDDSAQRGMSVYSKERIDDLVSEFILDCPAIRKLIESFADIPFESDFETIREHLKRVGSAFSLLIRGATIQPGSDELAIMTLQFLHETGFLNARLPDARQPKQFRHVLFSDEPNFVEYSNWNELQAAQWEVHPAFRSRLIELSRNKQARAIS
ncbi:MAG: hypothetical protein I8H71_14755 [Xanthomonadaceae bacterium]|nr:hypothetical protein [Xanthomonadaceae bacterium]